MYIMVLAPILTVFVGSIVYAKIKSRGAEKKGHEFLLHLRDNTYDARKILGEMRFIAEESFYMLDEFNMHRANSKKSFVSAISTSKKRDKLSSTMNHNLKAEWTPRYKFLKEIQSSFYNDKELYNAFKACKDIDNDMRKLSIWNITWSYLSDYSGTLAKRALTGAAIGAIASIAVASATQSMVNNAGKGMFNSSRSRETWIDRETGEKFDYNPNL